MTMDDNEISAWQDDLQEADEVFICNSVRGIVPITAIDDQEYGIGPVIRELQSWFLDGAR